MRKLALQKSQLSSDMHTFALQQIAGWQVAQKKVPSWSLVDEILYPPHLSLEQCSSELTAQYKASLISPSNTFVDLTGGMGVDFSFMARNFQQAIYVEQNEHLCQLAQHNFPLLHLNARVVNGLSTTVCLNCLQWMLSTWIRHAGMKRAERWSPLLIVLPICWK